MPKLLTTSKLLGDAASQLVLGQIEVGQLGTISYRWWQLPGELVLRESERFQLLAFTQLLGKLA
eukprot:4438750-Prymnesium_polylepis.1